MHTTLYPHAALGLSDHCLVHLLPAYSQKLKSAKPVTVKRWTAEIEQDLQACFELTDWSVFEAAATDLDALTDTVTSYISFCEDMCVPTRTYLTFNINKPWFRTKLKQLRQAKEGAYRSGDTPLCKRTKYTLNREIRVVKKNYSEKLKNSFQATTLHKCRKAWKPSPATRKTPSPSTEANQQLAEDLNEFYCRFEKQSVAWHPTPTPTVSQHSHQHPPPPPAPTVTSACTKDLWRWFKQSRQETKRLWWCSNLRSSCWPTWRTLLEPCLPSKQVCGWCSQHGIALHPPTSVQTRDLCKDPVCGLQLRFLHHHPGHPSE